MVTMVPGRPRAGETLLILMGQPASRKLARIVTKATVSFLVVISALLRLDEPVIGARAQTSTASRFNTLFCFRGSRRVKAPSDEKLAKLHPSVRRIGLRDVEARKIIAIQHF